MLTCLFSFSSRNDFPHSIIVVFQDFFFKANCISLKTRSAMPLIPQSFKINDRLGDTFTLMDLVIIYNHYLLSNYSFRKQSATSFLKMSTCFPDQGNIGHQTNIFTLIYQQKKKKIFLLICQMKAINLSI